MKRILFLVLLFVVATTVKAQYPVTQFLGSDSAMVKSRGGLQGRFAPIPFTDTAAANLSRISQYPGALIYTSGVDKYWYRNATVTGWIEFTSSGGSTVNIYNSDGALTGARTVDGDGNGLQFNSFRWFAVGADSVQIALNAGVFRVTGMTSTQDTSTYKPIVVDPVTGRVMQSSYWYGGSGGSGSYPSVPTIDDPNRWLVIPDKRNPIFSIENMGGGDLDLESSMYAPSPISINDTLFRVYAKGDATNSIHYWESRDSMRTWQYIDTALYPTPSPTWDSVDVAFPLAVYDNVNDTIHLYYTGGKGIGGPDYGIGHIAFKSNASHPLTRPASPFLSKAAASSLLGVTVTFIDFSSMVKKGGKHYWFGSYSTPDTVYLFAAKGSDWRNVDSMWRIMSPNAALGYNGIINPTVYKRGDKYYGIFADSRADADNVRDTSKSMLASMYSDDLITWTRLPGYFITPRGDTSWWGKQVYDMQILKVNGGNYDEPYKLYRDTTFAGLNKDQTAGVYYGFVSGSYFGCCTDQSGVIYILPQEDGYMNTAILDHAVSKDLSVYQRNNTLSINIPTATGDTRGVIAPVDFKRFDAKADSSGQWSYIHNKTTEQSDANFNISGYGRVKKLSAGGSLPDGSAYTLSADAYQNSGYALEIKNALYYGVRKLTQVTSEISELWNGGGENYAITSTSGNAFNIQAYKTNIKPIYYPYFPTAIFYQKVSDSVRNEFNGGNPSGFSGYGVSRTTNGIAVAINQADGFNTTSSSLISYAGKFSNTSTRESGSNSLTNVGLSVSASGGQFNYGLRIVDGSQGSGKVLTSDANGYASWQTLPGGGSGVYVDTLYNNGSLDSLIYTKNNIRYAIKYPASGGGSGWGLSGNSITAGVDKLGTSNNTSLRFATNATQRMILDSLGHIILGNRANTVYSNVMQNIVVPNNSGSSYGLFIDDESYSTIHYLANDGKAYHSGDGAFGGTLTTGNPGSGAGAWKLGTAVTTSGLVLNTTTYVEITIGGTTYRLAVVDPPQP